MADNPPQAWGSRVATQDEIKLCTRLIDRAHPGAIPPGRWPAEVRASGDGKNATFYVNVVAREAVALGAVYRTFMVNLNPGGEPSVSWFRSRRGERGDATLPPGDTDDETLPP